MAVGPASRRRIYWPAAVGIALALAGTLVVIAFGITNAMIARAIPYRWEATIGDQLVNAIDVETYECRAAPGTAVLQKLADRLAQTSGWEHKLQIHLVNSELPNAVTFPGGHIVVFTGLIELAKSGDEVAGVLAHEVGHAVNRHSMQQLTRGLGLAALASLMTGGAAGGAMVNYGAQIWQLSYSREAETEADLFAVATLRKAGLRNDGLVAFFRTIEAKHIGEDDISWLGTHPATPDRIKALQDQTSGNGQTAFTAAEWKSLTAPCQSTRKFEP